jgi:hypothetical protein
MSFFDVVNEVKKHLQDVSAGVDIIKKYRKIFPVI